MTPFKIKNHEQARMSVPNNYNVPFIKNKDQTIFKFPYTHYPFFNYPVPAQFFSTIVQCNINHEKINKVANLKCSSLVNLKKIVKLKNKNKNSQKNIFLINSQKKIPQTYQFYYEKVQFSLEHILQSKFKQNPEWKEKDNLSRVQIKKTLANLVALLYRQGIMIFLQFQDIGVNYQGVIKVYVAPHVLFYRLKHDFNTKILVTKSLDRVLRQIDAKYPKFQKIQMPNMQLKMNDLSIENHIIQSQQSIIIGQPNVNNQNSIDQIKFKNGNKKLLQNLEKSFNEDDQYLFVASGSSNFDNLKINQKIKTQLFNHNFNAKVHNNLKKQNKSKILLRMENKIDQLTAKIQQIRQKLHHNKDKNFSQQKAFKTMTTHDKTQIKQAFYEAQNKLQSGQLNHLLRKQNKKRKESLSSINFYTGVVPNQKNINCINIYHPKDKDIRSYRGITDDIISVDTYELQIGNEYQMPKIVVSMGLRNTLSPNKRKQIPNQDQKIEQAQTGSPKVKVHESAGGKNYGYIVNLLKPKFQPKKSNIFEEPQIQNEQESKKSTSLKKIHQNQSNNQKYFKEFKQQNQAQRNVTLNQENLKKQNKPIKVIDQYQQDLKTLFGQNRVSFMTSQTFKSPFQKRCTLPFSKNCQRNPQFSQKFLKNQQERKKNSPKISKIFIKNYVLQQKLKKAMQKTKKAINVLNQVKLKRIEQII